MVEYFKQPKRDRGDRNAYYKSGEDMIFSFFITHGIIINLKKINTTRNAIKATEMQNYFLLQLWFCMVKASSYTE